MSRGCEVENPLRILPFFAAIPVHRWLSLLCAAAFVSPAVDEAPYPLRRTVRYELTVRNTTAAAVKDAEVRLFAPVPQTAMQRVVDLDASQAFESIDDAAGNRTLSLRVDLPPFGVRVISVSAVVAFAPQPRPERLADPVPLTAAERFIEVDAPAIRDAARRLGGTSPDEIARRAYEWVADHVVESGYAAEDRGALDALTAGKGDCTESMYLFVALVRARGIPARGVEGFVIRGDSVLRSHEYHNWAEYYAGGTWHLADANRRVFGASSAQYLAVRRINASNAERTSRRRFEALHPALSVTMK